MSREKKLEGEGKIGGDKPVPVSGEPENRKRGGAPKGDGKKGEKEATSDT